MRVSIRRLDATSDSWCVRAEVQVSPESWVSSNELIRGELTPDQEELLRDVNRILGTVQRECYKAAREAKRGR